MHGASLDELGLQPRLSVGLAWTLSPACPCMGLCKRWWCCFSVSSRAKYLTSYSISNSIFCLFRKEGPSVVLQRQLAAEL